MRVKKHQAGIPDPLKESRVFTRYPYTLPPQQRHGTVSCGQSGQASLLRKLVIVQEAEPPQSQYAANTACSAVCPARTLVALRRLHGVASATIVAQQHFRH